MHLVDAFIQSDYTTIQAIHILVSQAFQFSLTLEDGEPL